MLVNERKEDGSAVQVSFGPGVAGSCLASSLLLYVMDFGDSGDKSNDLAY